MQPVRGSVALPLAFIAGAALTSSRLAALDALHIGLCAFGAFRPGPTAVLTVMRAGCRCPPRTDKKGKLAS